MAHAYKNFPPNGPLDDAKRPIGKCDCGRWEDSKEPIQGCPNAQATLPGFKNELKLSFLYLAFLFASG